MLASMSSEFSVSMKVCIFAYIKEIFLLTLLTSLNFLQYPVNNKTSNSYKIPELINVGVHEIYRLI